MLRKDKRTFRHLMAGIIAVFAIGLAGGVVFEGIGLYLPWMLGPLFFVLILKKWFRNRLEWPVQLRNAGLIFIGVQLGSSFTREAVAAMGKSLPVMLLTTVCIILFSAVMAWILSKWMGISLPTALLGSFPGGLTQMVVLSEEMPDSDSSVVAFMQTLRIVLVISIVPWIVTHLLADEHGQAYDTQPAAGIMDIGWGTAAGIAVLCGVFILIGRKIHLPIPYMLGPLLAAAVWNLSGFQAPGIPGGVLNMAQLCLGAHLGLTLKVDDPKLFRKMFSMVFATNVLLIGFTFLAAWLLAGKIGFPIKSMFLSLAPGGVAEMSVTALSVDADVSAVTSFHLFRILFILFILSPIIKWAAGKMIRKQEE